MANTEVVVKLVTKVEFWTFKHEVVVKLVTKVEFWYLSKSGIP